MRYEKRHKDSRRGRRGSEGNNEEHSGLDAILKRPIASQASFTVVVKEDDSKSEAKPDELGRSILAMSHCGMAVWVVVERSAKVLAFHTSPQSRMCGSEVSRGADESFIEVEPLIDLKVTGVVNKVLAGMRT